MIWTAAREYQALIRPLTMFMKCLTPTGICAVIARLSAMSEGKRYTPAVESWLGEATYNKRGLKKYF
jgi:hypothetical protein